MGKSKSKKYKPEMSKRSVQKTESVSPSEEKAAAVQSGKLNKPYYAGIDIIKILAAFFVVSIHFFLYSGFYYTPIQSKEYIAPIAMRWLVYTCVPLFMIATGYLMKNKKFSGKYYLGLIKIIVIYLVVSIPCMIKDKEVFNKEFTPWTVVKGFFEFTNAQYSWYVNFYIALFLLIPFLNLAFNGLENKKQRLALVITITMLSIVARSFFIGFNRETQIKPIPDYFSALWPLAYYYVGAFIREYPIKKKVLGKLIVFAILVADMIFITMSTYNQTISNTFDADPNNHYRFLSYHFNDYGTYPIFIAAVCIFLLLCDIKTTNKVVKFVLRQLGNTTLALYLISYVFDRKVYADLSTKYPDILDKCKHCFEPIGYVFIHALFWALIIQNVYDIIQSLIRIASSKIKQKRLETSA
jgi:hypothetical protein rflaF_13462